MATACVICGELINSLLYDFELFTTEDTEVLFITKKKTL